MLYERLVLFYCPTHFSPALGLINMTTADRLEFCEICSNKQFDFERGITCKLTNAKPAFEISCPSYSVVEFERQKKEKEQFNNVLGIQGLFEVNTYSTSNWWIELFRKRLPSKFEIRYSDFNKFLIAPFLSILVLGGFASFEFSPIKKIIIVSTVLLFSVMAIRFAWSQLVSNRMTTAIIDKNGIDIWGHRRIEWEEVSYTYVNTTLTKATIFLKVKGRKEPDPVKIHPGIGVNFFLTLVEAYRKNKTSKTSPNISSRCTTS